MLKEENRCYMVDYMPEEELNALLLKALFSLRELIVLDAEERIIYFSEDYAKTMGVDPDAAIGKPIHEVVPDSVLPSVLKSGERIDGALYSRNGNTMLVNRTPIMDEGKVIGVVAESILTGNIDTEEMMKKLSHLQKELNYYKNKYATIAKTAFHMDAIIGESLAMKDLKETAVNVARTRSTVLLTGESGTGKEVFAGAIHSLSERKNKPFVKLNCAAIPDTLLESELFGYVEGAFTGAVKGGKIGDFEAASGGTVFLDEVDSLSPNMQAKLLRAIQEREIKKVGGTKTIPLDVRFIFATNKDLYQLMTQDKFREDFYYRINVINLRLPPLRERREDIPLLIGFFLQKYNDEMGKRVKGIDPQAESFMIQYDWPGNTRELENCIERAFIYCKGEVLTMEDIRLFESKRPPAEKGATPGTETTLRAAREEAEKNLIRRMLESCGGNKAEVARRLEIDRSILYDKIRKYEL